MKSIKSNIMTGALALMAAGFGLASCANDSMMEDLSGGNTTGAPTLSLDISAPMDNMKIVETRATGPGYENAYDKTEIKTLDLYVFKMSDNDGVLAMVKNYTGSNLTKNQNTYTLGQIDMPLSLVGSNLRYVVVANNSIEASKYTLNTTKYSDFYNTTLNYKPAYGTGNAVTNDGSSTLQTGGMPFTGISSKTYKLTMGDNGTLDAITIKRPLAKIDVLNNVANLKINKITVNGVARSGYLLADGTHGYSGSNSAVYTRWFGGTAFATSRAWKTTPSAADAETGTLDYVFENTSAGNITFTINYTLTLSDNRTLTGDQTVTAPNSSWARNNRYLLQIGDDGTPKCINYPPLKSTFKVLGWYEGEEIEKKIDVSDKYPVKVGDVVTYDGEFITDGSWVRWSDDVKERKLAGYVMEINQETGKGVIQNRRALVSYDVGINSTLKEVYDFFVDPSTLNLRLFSGSYGRINSSEDIKFEMWEYSYSYDKKYFKNILLEDAYYTYYYQGLINRAGFGFFFNQLWTTANRKIAFFEGDYSSGYQDYFLAHYPNNYEYIQFRAEWFITDDYTKYFNYIIGGVYSEFQFQY